MRLRLHYVSLALILLSSCEGPDSVRSSPPDSGAATLVIRNAFVWTGDDEKPRAEAVAIQDAAIVAVGTLADITTWIGADTEIIDAKGGLVAPGFIDSHVHLLTGGLHLASVQLRDAATPKEFAERIGSFAASLEPGEWITGGDWDHENWGGDLPTREWIDALTPNNPVWVNRLDGHMSLANSAALDLAGVSADTPDVSGGEIVRATGGTPTGILKDNAMGLVDAVVVDHPPGHLDDALKAGMAYLNTNGVTSVHDMAGEPGSVDALKRVHERGEMTVRVYEAFPLSRWQDLAEIVSTDGSGDDWLRIGGLKAFVDGSLGSHTAAFFDPFTDEPGDSGLLVTDMNRLQQTMIAADKAGLQLFVHAIGDRAIAELLDAFDEMVVQNGDRDRRLRIEHAQHIRPSDINRFGKAGVVASMQPYHAIDDGRWAEKVVGADRIKTTYAFRSLLDSGATLAFGSDWFVAPPTPLDGLYAAVTRRTLDDLNPTGWVPEQRISLDEALKAYTIHAAHAGYSEDKTGILRPGMLADLVIIDRNLFEIPPEIIREASIAYTIVNGEIVFSSSFE